MYRLPAGYESERVHLLLTLELATVTVRIATADLDVVHDAAGETYRYVAALDGQEVRRALSIGAQEASAVSVPVDAVLPVDVAALAAEGVYLANALCEVAWWVEGTDWMDRQVVVRGLVRDPEYGEEWEAVRFSVEAQAWDDTVLIPAAKLAVSGMNWDHIDSLFAEHLGVPYPIVIGTPGKVSTTTIAPRGWIAGSRLVYAELDPAAHAGGHTSGIICILAGHHVAQQRVYVQREDAYTDGRRLVVRNDYDRSGNPIAWVPWYYDYTVAPADIYDYDAGAGYTYSTAADTDGNPTYAIGSNSVNGLVIVTDQQPTVWVGWYDSIDAGGGLQWRGRTLRGAGDVIEWALSQGSVPIDRARFEAAAPELARYKIDAVIEARVSPWQWLAEHVLPILPVTLAQGPGGYYPVIWRLTARAEDAEVRFDADADPRVARTSPIKVDTSKIVNDITVKYARNLIDGSYAGTARCSPGPLTDDELASTTEIVSPACARSRERYRTAVGTPLVAEREISTAVVYDLATALAIAQDAALMYATALETVTYSAPTLEYGPRAELGSVAVVQDSSVSLDERVALVIDIIDRPDGTTDFLLWLR